jgi:hypothetical protein
MMTDVGKADSSVKPVKPQQTPGNPVMKGWKIAIIGLAIALVIGLLLMKIGANRIKEAEQTRVTSESKLQVAVAFAAQGAIDELRRARLAINASNWGSAQSALLAVGQRVDLIQQIAPERRKSDAAELVSLKDELATAVSEHSPDAATKVDALEAALDAIQQDAG